MPGCGRENLQQKVNWLIKEGKGEKRKNKRGERMIANMVFLT